MLKAATARLLVLTIGITFCQLSHSFTITGCPSVRYRPPVGVKNGVSCFCDTVEGDQVDVTCSYGATTIDVVRAYQRVANATGVRAIRHFDNNEVNFRQELPRGFLDGKVPVKKVTIEACDDRMFMHEDAFVGQENHIEALTLSRCYFTDQNEPDRSLHPAIMKLYNLKNLTYQGTNLFKLNSSSFSNFRKLERLDLVANLLDDISIGTFDPIANSLLELDLSRNFYLKGKILEQLLPLRNVTVLILDEVDISDFTPFQFSNMKQLKTLSLARNSFTIIPENTFNGLDSLEILILRTNLLNYTEPGAFNGLPRLKKLYLGANYITDLNASSFVGMPALEFLELSYNDMGVLLPNTFQPLQRLASLDLKGSKKLDDISDPNIFKGLRSLKSLDLADTGVSNISQSPFQHLSALKTLTLSSNLYISKLPNTVFEGLSSLENLYLNSSGLDTLPEGIFENLNHLTFLDLSDNPWYCGEQLGWLVSWLNRRLNDPDKPIVLLNWGNTLCNLPDELNRFYIHNLDTSFLLERGANYSNDLTNVTLPPTQPAPTTPEPVTTTRSAFALDANDILSVKSDDGPITDKSLASRVIIAAVATLLVTTIAALIYVIVTQLRKDREARRAVESSELETHA